VGNDTDDLTEDDLDGSHTMAADVMQLKGKRGVRLPREAVIFFVVFFIVFHCRAEY
jgi:hypothetical protein